MALFENIIITGGYKKQFKITREIKRISTDFCLRHLRDLRETQQSWN